MASSKEEQEDDTGWLNMGQSAVEDVVSLYATNEPQQQLWDQLFEGLPPRRHKGAFAVAQGHLTG